MKDLPVLRVVKDKYLNLNMYVLITGVEESLLELE